MYIAAKFFNMFSPGDEIPEEEVKESWVLDGLAQKVESKEEFLDNINAADAELLDALDPDKTVKRGKNK